MSVWKKSLWMLSMVSLLAACGEGLVEGEEFEADAIESSLSSSQKRTRAELIMEAAAQKGLSNGFLLAGIAEAETGMAHCWSEAKWACQGPASSSCGGGPVIAGAGDGPCRLKQGGLGYFQFDGGTHAQTLARDGRDILTIEGNTRRAVDFTVDMVKRSRYIPGVSTREQALEWMNTVRPNGRNWDTWIKTVTHYYNGCVPGRCRVYNDRIRSYGNKAVNVYRSLGGEEFWYGARAPLEVPEVPSSLTPGEASLEVGDFISLDWDADADASSHELAMEYDSGEAAWRSYFTWTIRGSSDFRVWPQVPDAQYRWKVRSCNGAGCSEWSEAATFAYGNPTRLEPEPEPEPEPEGLQAPGDLRPGTGTVSRPSAPLTWSASEGAVSYDVQMMYQRSGSWRDYHTWGGRTGESFTVWPQRDNTQYRWRVRACDGGECSDWSEWGTFWFTGL